MSPKHPEELEKTGTSCPSTKWFSLLKKKKKNLKVEKEERFQREKALFNLQANPVGKSGGGGQAQFLGPQSYASFRQAGAPWPGAHLPMAALRNNFLSINANKSLDPSSK